MSYYYCVDCGELFDECEAEAHVVEEVHWWLPDRPTERLYFIACPYCHSEDIEECPTCEECGAWFHPDDLNEDGLCPDCAEKALEKQNRPKD